LVLGYGGDERFLSGAGWQSIKIIQLLGRGEFPIQSNEVRAAVCSKALLKWTDRRWTGDGQEMDRRWTGDGQEMDRRWTGDGQEMDRRGTGDGLEMDWRWTGDGLEMDWQRASGGEDSDHGFGDSLDLQVTGGDELGIGGIFRLQPRLAVFHDESFQGGFLIDQGGDDILMFWRGGAIQKNQITVEKLSANH
jgi:hypothetical protein